MRRAPRDEVSFPWAGAPPERDAAVRAALLPHTLEQAAARIPYYRRVWRGRWRKGLAALPFLTKDVAAAHQAELQLPGLPAFVGVVSSGTQFGDRRPLRVPETEREREAVEAFLSARASGAAPARRGLTLEVVSMQHGFPEGEPPDGVLRVPWSFTAQTLKVLQGLLTRRPRRIDTLVLSAAAIVPLTLYLLDQGVDLSALGVRDIGTTGFRLGPHWRQRVEESWGARLWDNFSLSEVAMPAVECEACGHHHWAWPAVHTEVVHPGTKQPVASGEGVLVLTTLWPFVQAMPLIRYWTGDVVALGSKCAEAGERGFRFRGRLTQCVLALDEPRPLLLSPHDVEAALDGRPEAARLPHPLAQLGVLSSPDLGVPRFEVDAARGHRLTVRVEVRFEPQLFPEAAKALVRHVEGALRLASPSLRALLKRGEAQLTVQVARPGTLTRRWTKF